MADQVLYSGVACITDLMVKEGLINLDFADVRSVMREMGKAMMGTGEASGDRRAIQAAEAAIANPLLDETSMKGARGLLISITGGKDLTLFEVDEAATRIREEVDPDANIILGATFEEALEGVIRVSVVATGIESVAQEEATPAETRTAEMNQRLRAIAQQQQPPSPPPDTRRSRRRSSPGAACAAGPAADPGCRPCRRAGRRQSAAGHADPATGCGRTCPRCDRHGGRPCRRCDTVRRASRPGRRHHDRAVRSGPRPFRRGGYRRGAADAGSGSPAGRCSLYPAGARTAAGTHAAGRGLPAGGAAPARRPAARRGSRSMRPIADR